jgi:hypothetical protein
MTERERIWRRRIENAEGREGKHMTQEEEKGGGADWRQKGEKHERRRMGIRKCGRGN